MGKIKVFLITVALVIVMIFLAGKEYTNLMAALDLNTRSSLTDSISNVLNNPNTTPEVDSQTSSSVNTDKYVVNNINYKSTYTSVVNKYIGAGKGYVSLNRILYFYNANPNFSFDEIYLDNLDSDNTQKKISDTCKMEKYKNLSVCLPGNIDTTNQIDFKQSKIFNPPITAGYFTITSYFMENRSYENHKAWDFAANSGTSVKSVCKGTVSEVNFGYTSNYPSSGYGNKIVIKCDNTDLSVLYAHLYPGSNKVRVGDRVDNYTEIASVGNTGYSTGSHLHFQVENSNSYVDGMSLIKF